MADIKSARSIWLHEWPINRPTRFDYVARKPNISATGLPTFERKNVCLSLLGLVHKSGNWISCFSALKEVYIHFPCTVDRCGASIVSPRNTSIKEKSPCQTVNMEKTPCQVKLRKKNDLRAPEGLEKKFRSQRVNNSCSKIWPTSPSSYSLHFFLVYALIWHFIL